MNSKHIIIGVLAGVTAGAVLGILFAPDKGSNTRKLISKNGEDLADTIKEKFNDFLESMAGSFDQAKDKAADIAEQNEKTKPKQA